MNSTDLTICICMLKFCQWKDLYPILLASILLGLGDCLALKIEVHLRLLRHVAKSNKAISGIGDSQALSSKTTCDRSIAFNLDSIVDNSSSDTSNRANLHSWSAHPFWVHLSVLLMQKCSFLTIQYLIHEYFNRRIFSRGPRSSLQQAKS